jgi:uncharacterized RmlC-like cupin family protein
MGGSDVVLRIPASARRAGAATPGMQREEAVATGMTWAGLIRTDPDMVSGWHHHGDYESVIYVLTGLLRMESGPGGGTVVEAEPGDFLLVPREAIHRESNPSPEPGTAIVVRFGAGDPVVNVEGPAASR